MELSRLLRRVLLVAAVAVAGWLLSAFAASTASADELPVDDVPVHSGQSDGLLRNLLGGLTDTLGGMTDAAAEITDSLTGEPADSVSPSVTPPAPVAETPETLPVAAPIGEVATAPADAPPAEMIFVPSTPAVAPARAVPPVVVVPVVPVAAPALPAMPVVQDPGPDAEEHAAQGGGHQRQPAKAPTAPAGTVTFASTTHDSFGGVRGAHGVLPAQDVLHPAGAGYTTRSLAVDAAGREAGLPSSSPD
ncbi:hypothetical protein [Actinophytocola sp.]|uniref:hypothetical protein n=1 Tax=Actinophytocola sp. TaxID=1872138 RepID=UPI002ED32B33